MNYTEYKVSLDNIEKLSQHPPQNYIDKKGEIKNEIYYMDTMDRVLLIQVYCMEAGTSVTYVREPQTKEWLTDTCNENELGVD